MPLSESTYQTLDCDIHDGIQTVSLNRGKANPINHQMVIDLRQLIHSSNQNTDIRGSILTGKPGYFSAGLDVIELYSYDRDKMKSFWIDLAALLADLASSPKPWIAAVSGHSPAGGCVLALCCDQRVMAEGAYRIGLNEVPVGIVVPMPIYYLYANIIGERLAYQYLLEGRLMLPQEAQACGLVDAVVSDEALMTEANVRLQGYLKLNPTVWQESKKSLRAPLHHHLTADFETTFASTLNHWWSPESRQQVGEMVQKLKK